MNDRAKMIALVAVVAFVVSAGFGFLAGVTGTRGQMSWLTTSAIGMSFGICALAIYMGLRGNRNVATANDGERQQALAGAKPGMGQLIVYRDGFVGKLAGVDILLDGAVVAQLKSPRFVALDVPSGTHAVSARAQGKQIDSAPVPVDAGQVVAAHVAMGMGGVKIDIQRDTAGLATKLASVPMVHPDGAARRAAAAVVTGGAA